MYFIVVHVLGQIASSNGKQTEKACSAQDVDSSSSEEDDVFIARLNKVH